MKRSWTDMEMLLIQSSVLGYTIYTLQEDPAELKKIQTQLKAFYHDAVAN